MRRGGSNINDKEQVSDKPKYQKATEAEATKYIHRYYALMHEQSSNKVCEAWKSKQEAKGEVFKILLWETTPSNESVPKSDNHPLMDSFHCKVRDHIGDNAIVDNSECCKMTSHKFETALRSIENNYNNSDNESANEDKCDEMNKATTTASRKQKKEGK